MKTLALIAAFLVSTAAAANGTPGTKPPVKNPTPPTKNILVNKPTTTIDNGNSIGIGIENRSGADAKASVGSTTVTTGDTVYPEQKMGIAPSMYTQSTANCMQAYGGSVGVYGFGGGVTGSVANENCEILELSRRFQDMGNMAASEQVLCLTERGNQVLTAMGKKCLVSPAPKTPEQPKVSY